MIKQLITAWESNKAALLDWAVETKPNQERGVLRLMEVTSGEPGSEWCPDVDTLTIEDGPDNEAWSGDYIYTVSAKGDPSRRWRVIIGYGSCSGCDAWLGAADEDDRDDRRQCYERLLLSVVQEFEEL